MIKFLISALFVSCFQAAILGEEPKQIKILAYNLENYLDKNSALELGEEVVSASKAIGKKAALIAIIAAEKPDILGVCEMGTPADFQDFLQRLKDAGSSYEYSEYVDAMDPERHIALASRFPITQRNSQMRLSFELNGKKQYFKRGILDVTVSISDNYKIQLVGAHLKSRREVSEDQALLRRGEAHLLRLHARQILTNDPQSRLILYGDLNDTINEASIRELTGKKGAPDSLFPVDLRDPQGEKWTHYWKLADTYARIDYVMVSRSLVKAVVPAKSYIGRPTNWNAASDHCPLIVTLKVEP